MNILDMESKEWEVGFRYWPQRNCKTYVLDRLIDFMASRKLQAGDIGNFYYICDKFALFTNMYIIIHRGGKILKRMIIIGIVYQHFLIIKI